MSDITYIGDYLDRGRERMLSEFEDTVVAMAEAAGAAIQLSEDDILDLYVSLPLTIASGAVLDRWGAVVGEPRLGLTDADYVRVINAKIASLYTAARPDKVAEVLVTLFEPSSTTYSRYVAHYRFNFTLPSEPDERMLRRINRIYASMRTAGVGSDIAIATNNGFRLGSGRLGISELGRVL